ncbi:MAG: YqiA/YcfP family alpha/beta fold hydrolase, partial [Bryobacteraceae bacterium]
MKVIYLHGFASGPSSAKALFFRERFAERGIEIAVPDLAAGNFGHLTITGQLGVVEQEAAGEPVSLIGSSMGGYVAALYAARHPEVHKLVLLAPAFSFAKRWPLMLGEDAVRQWRESGWLPVYHYAEQKESRVNYALLEDASHYEDYPEVTQPVLAFVGRGDDVVPCHLAEEFASSRPNVDLRLVDSGHE